MPTTSAFKARVPGNSTSSRAGKISSIGEVDFGNPDSIVSFVQGRWDARDQFRRGPEEEWFYNIAACLGYQWHVWDKRRGKMYLPDAPSYRVRLVCNRLMPVIRKNIAKAMRQRPWLTVVPATDEAEDAMVAQVGTKLLQYYWRFGNMDEKNLTAFSWLFMTGNVFYRTYWDPAAGQELGFEEEDFDLLGPGAQGQSKGQKFGTGDLAEDVVSPFEIDPDPNASCLEECAFILHSKVRSLDYLKARYPKAKELRGDATGDTTISKAVATPLSRRRISTRCSENATSYDSGSTPVG